MKSFDEGTQHFKRHSVKIYKVPLYDNSLQMLYFSFVRGNWRREDESTFSLMAKCCHDVDLIYYWMGEQPCTSIQSFGSLQHFKKSNQPEGAFDRCLGCPVEKACPYSAQKVYLSPPAPQWPMTVVCDVDIEDSAKYKEALTKALETGPYGRCVYACDNDVADSQVVNMQFEGGAVANLTMTAFTKQLCERTTRITGNKGELSWDGKADGPIILFDFNTKQETSVKPDLVAPPAKTCGHGGADFFLMSAFTSAIAKNNPALIKSGAAASLASHCMVFRYGEYLLLGTFKSRYSNKRYQLCNCRTSLTMCVREALLQKIPEFYEMKRGGSTGFHISCLQPLNFPLFSELRRAGGKIVFVEINLSFAPFYVLHFII